MYTDGIKINLTEEEIKNAIDWGAKNKASPVKIIKSYSFGKLKLYEDFGLILTKFMYLAKLSAMCAKHYDRFDKTLIKKVLNIDTLDIMITTYGSRENFLENSNIVLKQGKKIIRPIKILKQKITDPTAGFLNIPYYKGYIAGYFPYSRIKPKGKTIIILCKKRGESRFEVDFSRYK